MNPLWDFIGKTKGVLRGLQHRYTQLLIDIEFEKMGVYGGIHYLENINYHKGNACNIPTNPVVIALFDFEDAGLFILGV